MRFFMIDLNGLGVFLKLSWAQIFYSCLKKKKLITQQNAIKNDESHLINWLMFEIDVSMMEYNFN